MCGSHAGVPRSHAAAAVALVALLLVSLSVSPLSSVISYAAAQAANAEAGEAEVLYVRGCQEPANADARETTGCFASVSGSSKPPTTPIRSVHLSLQGVHLPTNLQDHRILLQEYRRPSLLGEEVNDTETRLLQKIMLLCEKPRASDVFPSQLITCEVVNPMHTMNSSTFWAPQLTRLVDKTMWFDVRIERKREAGDGFRPLTVLRRAVQLQVRNSTLTDNLPANSTQQRRTVTWEEVRSHPLERLYAPTTARNTSAKGKAANGVDADEAAGDLQSGEEVWVELGIGGLKRELRSLFRRVFLSRLPSLAPLADALELQHVRGVILYGPPGNGKTLIARNLFRLLGPNTRLSVVNAADILSKFVGESEKNLRDVFEGYDIGTSSKEESAVKDNNDFDRASHKLKTTRNATLQVLVIDEFEALFRRRGHSADESSAKAVYDGVTNTLLSLMDGVKSRNDLLVVGLTNRLQAIDPALLRPGRFEVLIEIPAPDVPGREDIFFIHTERLREHGFLAADVDLHTLALESGGFSGSDIAGTVRSAVSYSLLRYRKEGLFSSEKALLPIKRKNRTAEEPPLGHRASDVGGGGGGLDNASSGAEDAEGDVVAAFKVSRTDFERAMKDIRSAKDEASALSQLSSDGDGAGTDIIDYDGTVSHNLERASAVMERVMQSDRTVTGMIAITGAPGTGKSTIARSLTRVHDFTTVRYFSCRRLVELRDREEQLAKLRDAFSEASHTERGLVILDDYDILVDSMGTGGYAAMTLRGLLYEYMHRPGGVSRALVADSPLAAAESAGGEADGGNVVVNAGSRVSADRNHRMLVLTTTLSSVLQTLSLDAHLRVHPVLRRGAATLLQEYRVVDPAHATKIASLYPVSMSYRTFLRITDMSLQRWALTRSANAATETGGQSSSSNETELPAFFATADTMRTAYAELQAEQVQAGFHAVKQDDSSRSFASAVRATVADMGLLDPYQGWKGEGNGEEEEDGGDDGSSGGADQTEGMMDVDEVVGLVDEVLW